MERSASPEEEEEEEEESSEVEDKSSEKRSPMCFWKSSRSSISWSWLPSMDITWFLRMLIRPRNEPWLLFSVVAGIFGVLEKIR